MTIVTNAPVAPVFKTITVNVSVERAFDVFTAGFDSWWPRSHNISQSPMEKALIETFVGGRCYQRSIDGSECDWGRVIVWEPPHRFVIAWQLNADWQYDPDPGEDERGGSTLHARAGRRDARRSGAPVFRASRRARH
jgi:hypothetical protein